MLITHWIVIPITLSLCVILGIVAVFTVASLLVKPDQIASAGSD
jgi:hypothetical protein